MDSLFLCGFIVCLSAIYLIKWQRKKLKCNIPGPPSIPFLGSVPFVPTAYVKRDRSISDYLVEKYGDISSFYSGKILIVFISDADILRKIFKMEECSGRPMNKVFSQHRFGRGDGKSRGLLFSTEEEWKEQRRFSLRTLKDMGFGKSSMEDSINIEVQKLVNLLTEEHIGKPLDLRSVLGISVVNALWVLMSGESLELKDEKLKDNVRNLDQLLRQGSVNPFLALLGDWAVNRFDSQFNFTRQVMKDFKERMYTIVRDHEQTLQDDQAMNDYVGKYLNEIKDTVDSNSSFYSTWGKESLISSCVDLFLAGTETTTSTLIWGILFLLHNPGVKKHVQDELDEVLGPTSSINYKDRVKLPFTCAVINEIHRKASIVPGSLPHSTTKDVVIQGYTIPKGAMIIGNLIKIHHDKRYWSNPEAFDPQRFIDKESGKYINDINLMPFSTGKRYCLGQTLAEKELFLFFVGLMKAFDFTYDKNEPLPDCDYDSGSRRGIIRNAPIYNVILKPR